MAGIDQGQFSDGTKWTYGTCDDSKHKGKHYVSIGSKQNHTTFIIDSAQSVSAISARGNDKNYWRSLAVAVTSGYWD